MKRAYSNRVIKRIARNAVLTLLLMLAITGVTFTSWQYGVASPFTDPLDFRAFYCAGAAVAEHRNPYRLEPDRSCQRRVLTAAGLHLNEHFVLPAPLPPYALELFAAFARLPYRWAASLWMSLNILALIASIVAIAKLSGARPLFVGSSLLLSAGIVCLSLGQVVPIVLAAVAVVALCVRAGDGTGAAMGAAIATIEPHIALPIWLALGLFVPAARKPLLVTAVVLGTLTLLPGAALNIEYARATLPQHARAELINFEGQYSLSALLAALDVPAGVALATGTASYVAMLAFGLALGFHLKRRLRDAAFLIVAPGAAVVLGGPFVHIQQTVAAMPLGFMLVTRLPRYRFAWGTVVLAIVLLAIPWPLVDAIRPPLAPRTPPAVVAVAAPLAIAAADDSIEAPYTAFLIRFERRPSKHSLEELLARKLPTWFALIALLTVASSLAYPSRRLQMVQYAVPR